MTRRSRVRRSSIRCLTFLTAAALTVPAPSVAGAATPGTTLWTQRHAASADGAAVAVSPDGSTLFITTLHATIAYRSSTGKRLWVRPYHGQARSVAVSPSGSKVFVTGGKSGAADTDYGTVAYRASTGAIAWSKRYDAGNYASASSVAVSPDGSTVFVTGSTQVQKPSGTGMDYATVAYRASDGRQLWSRRYDGPISGSDIASALAVTPDGSRVLVTGSSEGTSAENRFPDYDYATVAYGVSRGVPLWTKRYRGAGRTVDEPQSVAASPDGSKVLVTGWSSSLSRISRYITMAYAASDGRRLWLRRFGRLGESSFASSMAMSASTVFVTGSSQDDYATVAYRLSNGATSWVRRYDGGSHFDVALSIAVSPRTRKVFVTGESTRAVPRLPSGAANPDYATVAYKAGTGAELWVGRYHGPATAPHTDGNDVATAVAVDPIRSRVFVSGWSEGTAGVARSADAIARPDAIATVAYAA